MRTSLNNYGRGPSEQDTLGALIGNPSGLRVLDAACASGRLTSWLLEQGASVVGLDLTAAMLDGAKARLASRAGLVQADLAEPLPFGSASFDLVLSAFTLHYLADWNGPLQEFQRVLTASGSLVVSVHHPFNDLPNATNGNYFQTAEAEDCWVDSQGAPRSVHFYRRPLSAMVESLHEAGFVVERILEAPPDHRQTTSEEPRMPWFLCFRALKR